MEAGADDYLGKPFSIEHLLGRLRVATRITNLQADLSTANELLARELETASRVQASLLPKTQPRPESAHCAHYLSPCEQLAGDLVGYFNLSDTMFGAYVLDVAGHGAGASLLSVQVGRLLSAAARGQGGFLRQPNGDGTYRVADPHSVIATLNSEFPMEPPANQFFTITYATVDSTTNLLRYCPGGHPTPLVTNTNGHTQLLPGNGTMVGIAEIARFETYEHQLVSGDRVILISDGVIECLKRGPLGDGSDDVQFGWDRLIACLSGTAGFSPEQTIEAVTNRLAEWRGDEPAGDDASILVIAVS